MIIRRNIRWIVWIVLLWPGESVAQVHNDIRWLEELIEDISDHSYMQRLMLSDYLSPENTLPTPKQVAVPTVSDITYIQAVALYVARDYENAFKAFKKLFLKDMSSPKINFYLGLSAYELGDFDGAIAAYERVLFIEPNNARCRFELGRSYYALKMYEQAEIEFRKVLQLTSDKKLIRAIGKYITRIDAFRKRHFFSGSISAGVLVDNNVNNGNDCVIPILGNRPVNPQLSDYGHMENVMARYLYDAGDKNDFFWMNEVVLYNKSYENEHDFNILFSRLQTGIEYKSPALFLMLPVGYEYLRYGEEAYLDASDIGLKLYYPLKYKATLHVAGKYKEEVNLKEENRDYDANSREVTVGMQNIAGDLLPGISCYLTQRERRKVRGDEKGIDSTMRKMKLNYQKTLQEGISLYPQYTYRELSFLQKQYYWFEAFPIKRLDRTHQLSLTLLFKYSDTASLTMNYTYSDITSTYKLYTYDKGTFSLSYNMMFE